MKRKYYPNGMIKQAPICAHVKESPGSHLLAPNQAPATSICPDPPSAPSRMQYPLTSKLVQYIHAGWAKQADAQEYASGPGYGPVPTWVPRENVSAVKHPSFTAMSKKPFDVDVVDVLVVEIVLVVLGGAVVSSGGVSSGLQFLAANILGSSTC